MIVEHVFVTAREQAAAFDAAGSMLATLAFSPRESASAKCENCGYSLQGIGPDRPCPECGTAQPGSRRISFSRGKKNPRNSPYSFHQHPLVVMLEFDRGRVTAVLSLEMRTNKPHKLQTQMLTSLAEALEAAISGDARAAEPALAVQQRIISRANTYKWFSWILLGIILLPIAILIIIAIVRN